MLDWKALSTDEVVARYVEAASEHASGTESGDVERTNSASDAAVAAHVELQRRGAERVLLALLDHPEPGVRGWAGFHCLEFAPDQAEPVLEELAQQDGLVAFTAEMTLERWRKGELSFPIDNGNT